jgi:uncharacterized RDD family membrane protein YckC
VAAPDPLSRLVGVIVPRAVESIDLDAVLAEVDIDAILTRVDVDAIVRRVDIDAIVRRVDVDAIVRRVDIPAILERVDIDSIVNRIDLEKLMERIDIGEIVQRAQVEAIVRTTAGGLGNRFLDLLRRQLVGLDILVTRIVDRVLHRVVEQPVAQDGTFTGQLAGGATRLAAFLLDAGLISLMFTGTLALCYFLASLFVGHDIKPAQGDGIWHLVEFAIFAIAYQWVCLVVAGRSPGKALAGLRVTAPDGSPLGVAAATRRVLVYPFSFVLGLGLIGIVTGRRHRALHDMAAPSLVRYDWGDRPAEMSAPITRFFERRGVEVRNGRRDLSALGAVPADQQQ